MMRWIEGTNYFVLFPSSTPPPPNRRTFSDDGYATAAHGDGGILPFPMAAYFIFSTIYF
jgi:hypothetical protein